MGRRRQRAAARATTVSAPGAPSPGIPWPAWAALTLVAVLAYLPALGSGFIWDDDAYVTQNLTLRSAEGLWRIWFHPGATPQYYPLVHTTFWIEYHLWGLAPFGFHLVNVLMHAGTAFLVLLILRRLEVPGAAFVAGAFLLHPVHVESVAWITERKNVLSALLYMGSVLAYLRFAGIGGAAAPRPRRAYGLAFALFTGAMLSKTVAASMPAAILLIAYWKKGRLERRDVAPLVPFFAVGLALGLATAYVEKHHVGASGLDWALSPLQRVLIAGRALWFYAAKLVWPMSLTFIYPRWTIDSARLAAYVYPAAAVGAAVLLWALRGRLGRGPLAAVLFFGGTLVPALGFFDVYPMRYSFVADHFQYVASLGLLTLAGAAAAKGFAKQPPAVAQGAALAVLVLLGALTYRQARIYHDQETLWRDTIAKNPEAWMAHHNLGGILEQQSRDEEALAHYREALRLKPDFADVHNNVGNILARHGEIGPAIASYEASLRLLPEQAEAHSNLGAALASQGRYAEAMRHYEEARRIKPGFAGVHVNLGNVLLQQGRPADALPHYQTALALDPDDAGAHYNYGNALLAIGRTEEAEVELREALRLRPGYTKAQDALGRARARAAAPRETVTP